jgi:hypothetical protein
MSLTTLVPPKTDRFNLPAIDAEIVAIPESKDLGTVAAEAKAEAVIIPKSKGSGGFAAADESVTVEIHTSKDVLCFTAADKALLEKQESVIASNIGAFLLLGGALAIIKGRELQRILDPKLTFDQYCSNKWGFGQAYAYRLISAYDCVKNLKGTLAPKGVTVFPTNEAQVRPLTSLLPADQAKAWAKVVKTAGTSVVTATLVSNIVHGSSAKKADKTATVTTTSAAGPSAEQQTLVKIAKLVGTALRITPKKRTISKLSAVLEKIQDLLDEE